MDRGRLKVGDSLITNFSAEDLKQMPWIRLHGSMIPGTKAQIMQLIRTQAFLKGLKAEYEIYSELRTRILKALDSEISKEELAARLDTSPAGLVRILQNPSLSSKHHQWIPRIAAALDLDGCFVSKIKSS